MRAPATGGRRCTVPAGMGTRKLRCSSWRWARITTAVATTARVLSWTRRATGTRTLCLLLFRSWARMSLRQMLRGARRVVHLVACAPLARLVGGGTRSGPARPPRSMSSLVLELRLRSGVPPAPRTAAAAAAGLGAEEGGDKPPFSGPADWQGGPAAGESSQRQEGGLDGAEGGPVAGLAASLRHLRVAPGPGAARVRPRARGEGRTSVERYERGVVVVSREIPHAGI